jgi:hypothetical protein
MLALVVSDHYSHTRRHPGLLSGVHTSNCYPHDRQVDSILRVNCLIDLMFTEFLLRKHDESADRSREHSPCSWLARLNERSPHLRVPKGIAWLSPGSS